MENKAHERYKWLCQQLEQDAEYLHLMERLRLAQPDFAAAMAALPPEHRQSIYEYIGILGEIAERSKEISCYGW